MTTGEEIFRKISIRCSTISAAKNLLIINADTWDKLPGRCKLQINDMRVEVRYWEYIADDQVLLFRKT